MIQHIALVNPELFHAQEGHFHLQLLTAGMKQTDGKSPAPNADEHAGTWEQFRSSWAIKVRKEERRNKERKVKGKTSKAAAPKAATLQSTLRHLKSVCTVILTCDAIGEAEMATLESAISEVQAARTNTIAVKRH